MQGPPILTHNQEFFYNAQFLSVIAELSQSSYRVEPALFSNHFILDRAVVDIQGLSWVNWP